MSWQLAPALVQLRAEVNAAQPGRDRASDGSIGDRAHASRKSDHNPNRAGYVRAIDVDAGPGITPDEANDWLGDELAGFLVRLGGSGTHPALGPGSYVIWERRLYSAANAWLGRPYDGANPHESHVHVSVATAAAGYKSTQPWGVSAALGGAPAPQPTPPAAGPQRPAQPPTGALPMPPTLRRGAKGQHVRNLQGLMLANGCKVGVDGDFGPATDRQLRAWQRRAGIGSDGIAGPVTWRHLIGV